MFKYLLDTNIIIDYLRFRNSKIAHYVEDLNNNYISYIVVGELMQGVKNKKDLLQTQKLISAIEVDYGSVDISAQAIDLCKKYYLKYNIGFLDALIAATALTRSSTLVTYNSKHFKCIKELKVIVPK